MNKEQFEDLVLNYCYAIYDDMSDDQIRAFIIGILYDEKRHLKPDQLVAKLEKEYPELIAK